MYENRTLYAFGMFQSFTHFLNIMTVHRAYVLEAQFFKENSVYNRIFYIFLGVVNSGNHALSDYGNLGESLLNLGLHVNVLVCACNSSQ